MSDEFDKKDKESNVAVHPAFSDVMKLMNANKESRLARCNKLTVRQKLLEWVKRDTWILKTEAMQLMQGISPEYADIEPEYNQKYSNKIYDTAFSCVGVSLHVLNQHEKPNKYRVKSDDFINWLKENSYPINKDFLNLYYEINPNKKAGTRSKYTTTQIEFMYELINELEKEGDIAKCKKEYIEKKALERMPRELYYQGKPSGRVLLWR